MTTAAHRTDSTARPRLLLISQFFDPEPSYRGLAFARDLERLGYDVEVVTGFPNYPGGTVYDGYRIRLKQVEVMDGIRVTRLPLYPSHDAGRIGRILNYVSFMLALCIYLLLRRRKTDLYYVYHPPITVGIGVALARIFRRRPLVLEVQDMWPDTLAATGMIGSPRVLGIVGWACRWLYRRCDRIIVQSAGFRQLLEDRGVPASKLTTVLNWAEVDVLHAARDTPAPGLRDDDGFRVIFAGTMGKAQALDTVLAAARTVARTRPDVTFYFIGGGIALPQLQASAQDIPNAVFLPRVPLDRIGAFLARGDALLVHLRDDPLFAITIPSKIPAYLAMGRPVIIGVRGDAAALITQADAGLAVPPEDADALAAAVLDLAGRDRATRDAMGARGLQYYMDQLDAAHGLAAFDGVFRDALAQAEGDAT